MLIQKLSAPSSIKIFWEIDISFTDIFSKWNMNQEKLVANNRCRLLMLTRSCKAPFSISKFFNNQLHRMSKRIQAMKISLKLLFFHNVFKKTPKLLIKKTATVAVCLLITTVFAFSFILLVYMR